MKEHAQQSPNASGAPIPENGAVLLNFSDIQRTLKRIAHEILERNGAEESIYLVAIPNGGVPLARILQKNLTEIGGIEVSMGILDTTLHRDDLSLDGQRPRLRHTEMPSAVDDHAVILVDDVLSTGRTIRAAMDALMNFGRPKNVQVVALVDRGHRELPIRSDYVGKNIPTHENQTVKLRGIDGSLEGDLEVAVLAAAGGAA